VIVIDKKQNVGFFSSEPFSDWLIGFKSGISN